jgi:CRISPR-associated protein Csb1
VATEVHADAHTGEVSDRPSGKQTVSRVDPLGIRSGIKVYKLPNGDWSLDAPDKKAKALRPSEINHFNIAPSVTQLGVSIVENFTSKNAKTPCRCRNPGA